MTIASRLSLFLPCCLLLFSIPASADAQMVVRKKPGRTTYSKTASGVTDGNEDDIVTAYSHTNSRGQTYYGIGDDGNGDDIVTAYSHTNSRGQTYYEDSGPDDSRGGNLRGSITVNLVNVKDAPAGSDIGPVGWDIGPVGSDVGLVGWDIGPVAIEYAMMASLMGYSDSEAIEYGIIVALIHAVRADAPEILILGIVLPSSPSLSGNSITPGSSEPPTMRLLPKPNGAFILIDR